MFYQLNKKHQTQVKVILYSVPDSAKNNVITKSVQSIHLVFY